MTDELSARAALIAASIIGLVLLLLRYAARRWGQQNAQATADLDVWRAVEERMG